VRSGRRRRLGGKHPPGGKQAGEQRQKSNNRRSFDHCDSPWPPALDNHKQVFLIVM
jgi:hypothetical protein